MSLCLAVLALQGTLVVLNKSEASASLIDLATEAVVATVATGEGPHEVAVSPDGRRALATNYGTQAAPGSTLTLIDIEDGRALRTIALGEHRRPHGVAWLPDGRRAVVFGGSNLHILKPEYVEGGKVDVPAAKALICFWTSPEWSLKMAYAGSNPGNLNGFKTKWMKERLDKIKFLDVTTSMLPYGIPFPALPQSPEIMNIIVPDMLQNALTGKMTVDEAADDAAAKVEELLGGM